MADESGKAIIIEVDIDEGAVGDRLVELRKDSDLLRQSKEQLKAELKAGRVTNEQYATSIAKIKLQERELSREIADQQKTLDKLNDVRNAANGSLDQMRANLSLLTQEFDGLSDAERKNEDVGGALQKRIKSLSDELKDLEESTGRNYRSVGDYLKLMRVGGASVGEMEDALKKGFEATQTFTKGILTGRGALIALTAVPVVLILTALAAVLTKSQAGMDKLAQFTKGASLALDALIGGFVRAGRIIVDSFQSWEKFTNLFTDLRNNAKATQGAIIDAAKAGMEIAKANQAIEDSEIALSLRRAKNQAQIEKLKKLGDDVTKSDAVRRGALNKAYELENTNMQEGIKLQQQRINNLQKEQDLKKKNETLGREDARAMVEEQKKLYELEQENAEKTTELQNNLNGLAQESAQKARDARALALQESVAQAEAALVMAKQKGEQTLAIEEEIIRRRAKADKFGLLSENVTAKQVAQQRKLIDTQANAEIIEARIKYAIELANKESRITQDLLGARLALAKQGSDEELQLQKDLVNDKRKRDKSEAVDTIKDKKEQKARLYKIDADANAAIERLDDGFKKSQLEQKQDLDNRRLQTEVDLGLDLFAAQLSYQRRQIQQEEKHALDLLKLEEDTARERGQLDEKLQEELLVKRNQIQAKALAAEKQLKQQALEREKADAVARAEARLAATVEGSRKELDAQKDLLKKKYEQEIANTKLTEDEKKKIKEEYNRNNAKLDKDYTDKLINDIVATVSLAKDTLSTIFEAQSAAVFKALDDQQEAALKSAGANADLRARIEEKYNAKREELEKQAAKKRQKIASIENLIATAQATTQALTLFAKNPILGAITEALILTKAIAQQSIIDSAQFLADGGVAGWVSKYVSDGRGTYLRGPGTTTSDSIPARLSTNESVINAKSTAMYYDELSRINVAGGGRPFPGATSVETPKMSGFAYGGVPVNASGDTIAAAVISGLKGANFAVSVTEFNEKESDMIYAKSQGDY